MADAPAVSVIIPAYNVEAYLADAVRSVLEQTFADFELIIVDDCSPDASGRIADEFAAKDARVRVIHHTANKQRSGALNTGIRAAKGKYVSILDADDWYKADKLERQVAYLETHPAVDMVYGDFEYLREGAEHGAVSHALPSTQGIRERLMEAKNFGPLSVMSGGFIPSCAPLVRTQVFEKVQFDESMRNMEDLDMWLQFFGAGFTAEKLAQVTYTYRYHNGQKSRNQERMKAAAEIIAEKMRTGAYLK